MNSGPCKAEVVFHRGLDPKTTLNLGHGVLQALPRILPELRAEAEDGLQSPLFQTKISGLLISTVKCSLYRKNAQTVYQPSVA